MNAKDPSLANILQTQGHLEPCHVSKYQRKYTWGRGVPLLGMGIIRDDRGFPSFAKFYWK